jgi:hypothetical protein
LENAGDVHGGRLPGKRNCLSKLATGSILKRTSIQIAQRLEAAALFIRFPLFHLEFESDEFILFDPANRNVGTACRVLNSSCILILIPLFQRNQYSPCGMGNEGDHHCCHPLKDNKVADESLEGE